jgi:hypothetical protein
MIGRTRFGGLATAAVLLGGAGYAAAAPTPALAAGGTHVCRGSAMAPGTLAGFFNNVEVKGFCAVNGGAALVHGNLTVDSGSALVAAFARNDVTGKGASNLIVLGNFNVNQGGAAFIGCLPTSFPCIDDPNPNHPTLASHDRIQGNLASDDPLGVIVHNTRIGGDVTEEGGGGGLTCNPSGIFAVFGSPVYSDYEDSTVVGGLRINHLTSCWLGVARVHSGGGMRFIDNQLADPDAIEIIANNIGGNLACSGNSMTWDNADAGESLFPRIPEPNTVHGSRSGQCVLSSPNTRHDHPGPGAF